MSGVLIIGIPLSYLGMAIWNRPDGDSNPQPRIQRLFTEKYPLRAGVSIQKFIPDDIRARDGNRCLSPRSAPFSPWGKITILPLGIYMLVFV